MAEQAAPHHATKLSKLLDDKLAKKLANAGLERVHHVRALTDAELRAIKGLGAKAVQEIRAACR